MTDAGVLLRENSPEQDEADGEEAAKHGGEASHPPISQERRMELLRKTWTLVLVAFLLNIHTDIDTSMLQPYFFTRVVCCGQGEGGSGPELPQVGDYAGHDLQLFIDEEQCDCDIVETYGKHAVDPVNRTIRSCDVPALPADDALWSHSDHCNNFPFVQQEAQTLRTTWGSLQALCFLVYLPVCAKISDTYGRRQVFLYTTILSVVAFLVFTLDALWLLGDWAILITAPLMATNAPHQVVMWSMFVDMVSDPIDQASFFPFVASIEVVAPLIVDFLSYFILRGNVSDF